MCPFWPWPAVANRVAHEVAHDLATLLVIAERPRRTLEVSGIKVGKQILHSRGPGPGLSAHRPIDQNSATCIAACAKLFGRHVDWLIDSGVCRVKVASSVVDLSHYPFMVTREGAISKKVLEKVLRV